jgi:protein SCO1/2
VVSPPVPAPTLTLTNYAGGRKFSISSVRGRAVFVTFVYTHCPDVCPLIVSELAEAQRELGAQAGRARFVAVTIDPGRDTPTAVRAFLAARGAIGRVQYLLGSHTALARVWKAWHVRILPGGDATLAHTSVVYGLDAGGMIRVMYPANFTPAEIVHDVPLLARS